MFPLIRSLTQKDYTIVQLKLAGRVTELPDHGAKGKSTKASMFVIKNGTTYQDYVDTSAFKGRVENLKRGHTITIDLGDGTENPKLLNQVVADGVDESVDVESTATKAHLHNRHN